MEKREWSHRLVKQAADGVRLWRDRRGISAQVLSDRCTELGFPIKRSVLSNLESGYRETITLPELFVLAEALEVPVLLLLLPIGRAETVELLPGAEVEIDRALNWVLGGARIDEGAAMDQVTDEAYTLLDDFVHHLNTLAELELSVVEAEIQRDSPGGSEDVARRREADAAKFAADLADLRASFREREAVPPALPSDFQYVDDPRFARRRRRRPSRVEQFRAAAATPYPRPRPGRPAE